MCTFQHFIQVVSLGVWTALSSHTAGIELSYLIWLCSNAVCLMCSSGPHLPLGVPSPHQPFAFSSVNRKEQGSRAMCVRASHPHGDKTSPVLTPTKGHRLKTHIGVCQLAWTTLHTPLLQALYRTHSSEGVGSARALKDALWSAGCCDLLNLIRPQECQL